MREEEEEEEGTELSLWGWSRCRALRWHMGLGELRQACAWGPAPRTIPSSLTESSMVSISPEQKQEPSSWVGLWPRGACPHGRRDCPSCAQDHPGANPQGFPPALSSPPGFLPCVRGQRCQSSRASWFRGCYLLLRCSVPTGADYRDYGQTGHQCHLTGKAKAWGGGSSQGWVRDVLPPPSPPTAWPGVPALPSPQHQCSPRLQKG